MIIKKEQYKENFLSKAKDKYENQPYDYSKVRYVNKKTKVIITCVAHGDFRTTPINFLSRRKEIGCPHCSREKRIKHKTKDSTTITEIKGRERGNFNVYGGTNKYQHLLLKVFDL